jgi:hypothetical protein
LSFIVKPINLLTGWDVLPLIYNLINLVKKNYNLINEFDKHVILV